MVWASRSSAQALSLGLGCLGQVVGELDPVEREVALAPLVAPALDHQREQVAILVGPAGVRLALVPDGAPDAVADRRLEDAVVDVAGPGIAAHLAIGVLGPRGGCLPSALAAASCSACFASYSALARVVLLDLLPTLEQGAYFGSAASRSRRIHASQAEPPQASLIRPTGTPSVSCNWRPKK